MLTLNVDDTVARVRKNADLETTDESLNVVLDAEILEHLNDAYRELWDIAAEKAPNLVTTSASVASPYALPADFMQPRYIDYTVGGAGGHVRTLLQYPIATRNHYQYSSTDYPRWRISMVDDVIRFLPTAFAGTVTLYYIGTAPALVAAGTYNAFQGWDQYLIAWGLRAVRDKQEYDVGSANKAIEEAERRIRRSLARMADPPNAISDVETLPDPSYYG